MRFVRSVALLFFSIIIPHDEFPHIQSVSGVEGQISRDEYYYSDEYGPDDQLENSGNKNDEYYYSDDQQYVEGTEYYEDEGSDWEYYTDSEYSEENNGSSSKKSKLNASNLKKPKHLSDQGLEGDGETTDVWRSIGYLHEQIRDYWQVVGDDNEEKNKKTWRCNGNMCCHFFCCNASCCCCLDKYTPRFSGLFDQEGKDNSTWTSWLDGNLGVHFENEKRAHRKMKLYDNKTKESVKKKHAGARKPKTVLDEVVMVSADMSKSDRWSKKYSKISKEDLANMGKAPPKGEEVSGIYEVEEDRGRQTTAAGGKYFIARANKVIHKVKDADRWANPFNIEAKDHFSAKNDDYLVTYKMMDSSEIDYNKQEIETALCYSKGAAACYFILTLVILPLAYVQPFLFLQHPEYFDTGRCEKDCRRPFMDNRAWPPRSGDPQVLEM